MPKYGVFNGGSRDAIRTFEADYLFRDKEMVEFRLWTDNDTGGTKTIAIIHLDKGQSISEIK